MQDGGANTNANSNGPKWQRMKMCAVSVLLFLFSLLLVFAPNSCVPVLLLLFFADVASVFDAVVFRSVRVFFNWCIRTSLDNKQLKNNKHTYIRYTIAIMSYSSRNTISIHYISICINCIIRHDRL